VLSVTWFGTTCVLVSDGETALLVDPFGHAERQMKHAVELSVVAQDPGSHPPMRTQAAHR